MELKDVKNIQMLSEFLGINQGFFEIFISNLPTISTSSDSEEIKKNSLYTRTLLPKRNKKFGYRTVYRVQSEKILNAHKELQSRLNKLYHAPDCVHGFVHGRGIRSNASAHLAKKYIFKIDIKNFFESITQRDVANMFQKLGCIAEMSEMVAKLVTLEGKLVQGFVTSPVIANFVVYPMDIELNNLCKKNGFNYTRYADDITISSNTTIPESNPIELILASYGFTLNKAKTIVMLRGRKQYVTGLTVFDDKYPRIAKKSKRNLRLQIYFLKKYGSIGVALHKEGVSRKTYERDDEVRAKIDGRAMLYTRRVKGQVDFVHAIEPVLAQTMYDDLKQGLDRILV